MSMKIKLCNIMHFNLKNYTLCVTIEIALFLNYTGFQYTIIAIKQYKRITN